MNRIRRAVDARRARSEQYRNSIHYAISHASSESERNELIDLAIQQGIRV
jgi:hypothetical protein